MKKPVIICVDDEQMILNSLNTQLRNKFGKQFVYEFAEGGEEALELIDELVEDGYEVVMLISDQIMPGMTGDQLLVNVHEKYPRPIKVLLTGQASLNSAVNAINNANLYRYLHKPWDREDFLLTVEKGIQQYNLLSNLEKKVSTFGKFVPKQFLEHLSIENYEDICDSEAKQVHLSILFADIRKFTALSETMTPKQVFALLNEYFCCMDNEIEQNHGFIDKFMGDGIMALFGRSTTDSVKAAIDMQQKLRTCRKDVVQPIDMGIGINTGELLLGTVGSGKRIDSTVVGDAVNIASRMENLTKYYDADIIISESSYQTLDDPHEFEIRELDFVRVYGKVQPIKIYEIIHDRNDQHEQLLPIFSEMLNLYRQQEWGKAIDNLDKCLKICPDDTVSHLYMARCQEFKLTPPLSSWDGSFNVDKCE
ncbi:adenylate/guanylate cyclase domain-containing protein [Thiotrichales bacterium HSG1]|nr:adenylate/guanylate cyclase domain-containing protein [Thiotrichales bacterium HSG1]